MLSCFETLQSGDEGIQKAPLSTANTSFERVKKRRVGHVKTSCSLLERKVHL